MLLHTRTLKLAAALGAVVLSSASANAASDPTGIWFDHNGRGAIEISACSSGKGLCGYVIHVTDAKNNDRCGLQILGNVTSDGGGWIYSPERGKKYSVELTRLSDDKLRVVGNAGSFFSKTFTWKRAPDDVSRCGEQSAAAPAEPATETQAAPAPTKKKTATAAPSEPSKTRSLGGGYSNGSLALIANAGIKTAAATSTEEPVATEEPAPKTTEKASTKTEPAAAEPAAAEPETKTAKSEPAAEEEFVPEKKCKFKIPYVGKVIDVPCRD
jgi:uncharacterized protein (DUF2147 family)